jgi:hypothetical protein
MANGLIPVSTPEGIVYPDVPLDPGVPPLVRTSLPTEVPERVATDSVIPTFSTAWGIYNADLRLVLVPDTIAALDFKREYAIADYPIEGRVGGPTGGQFESYDKVATPYECRIRMAVGSGLGAKYGYSGLEKRTYFLKTVDAMVGDLQLYHVVTPEVTYPSANLARYDYRRSALNGLGLLIVDLLIKEVRLNPGAGQIQIPVQPGSAEMNIDGTVFTWTNVQWNASSVQAFPFPILAGIQ